VKTELIYNEPIASVMTVFFHDIIICSVCKKKYHIPKKYKKSFSKNRKEFGEDRIHIAKAEVKVEKMIMKFKKTGICNNCKGLSFKKYTYSDDFELSHFISKNISKIEKMMKKEKKGA